MAWTLATSLTALRRDLNTTFPNRDKASDGTIGDDAHKRSTSGHNPDDTAGSKSEYTDADSRAEVRAYDADKDLRAPGVDFQQVIDRILATPADRDRLAYVIYRRRIWRKRNNWRAEAYVGDNPHDEHAHFSGDPAHDENGGPWTSILSFQQKESTMPDTTSGEVNNWTGLRRIESLYKNLDRTVVDSAGGGEVNGLKLALTALEARLSAKLDALAVVQQGLLDAVTRGSGSVDVAAILAGVDTMLDALAREQRDAVADLGEGGAAQVRGPQAPTS